MSRYYTDELYHADFDFSKLKKKAAATARSANKSIEKRDFWQMPCALGADLSQGNDFCAFTFLFPLSDGRYGINAIYNGKLHCN